MTFLKPAQKSGKKFLNPVPTAVGGLRTILKALPQLLNNKQEREPRQPLGPFVTDAAAYATEPSSGLRVTWFGHSSSLIEMDGVRILVDPVWDVRASPFQWMGPKRFYAPTLEIEALPLIDVVLVSHDHYDHLGAGTVRRLARADATAGARWVTALGVGRLLHGFGVAAASVVELDWTEGTEVDGLRVTMWPSRHFSGRSLFNRDQTLWGAFVLEGPRHRVYYGADTGPWEGFAEIAAQYGGFDLTMLEIGASSPLWPDIHLGPDAAAAAFAAMGGGERAGLLMPIHWGLFNLALHAWRDPVERMLTLGAEQGLPLWLPRPGEPAEVVRGTALRTDWWV